MAPTLASTATKIAAAAVTHVALPLLQRRDDDDAGAAEEDECSQTYDDSRWGLRIGAIFVILVTSLIGTVLPIALRSSKIIPRSAFE